MDFFLIRVKFRENFAFVKFLKEELNVNEFRQRGIPYKQ